MSTSTEHVETTLDDIIEVFLDEHAESGWAAEVLSPNEVCVFDPDGYEYDNYPLGFDLEGDRDAAVKKLLGQLREFVEKFEADREFEIGGGILRGSSSHGWELDPVTPDNNGFISDYIPYQFYVDTAEMLQDVARWRVVGQTNGLHSWHLAQGARDVAKALAWYATVASQADFIWNTLASTVSWEERTRALAGARAAVHEAN